MATDFTTIDLSESVYKNFLFLMDYRQASPIVCFGENRKFLKYMTHNTIGGQYVS